MNGYSDTNIVDGAAPFYQVIAYQGSKPMLHKAYKDRGEAYNAAAALRMNGVEAKVVIVGATTDA